MLMVPTKSNRGARRLWAFGATATRRHFLIHPHLHPGTTTSTSNNASSRKLAVVFGVANHRSIAWACVQEFLRQGHDCVFTYQDARHASKMEQLIRTTTTPTTAPATEAAADGKNDDPVLSPAPPRVLGCLPCNVETPGELEATIRERLPELLLLRHGDGGSGEPPRQVNAIVHSLAYCREMDRPLLQTSLGAYLQAQHVSAYSLLETARCFFTASSSAAPDRRSNNRKCCLAAPHASLTALTYLGAERAVPGYGAMGPAKAALESLVRGLAAELASAGDSARCNAVSAGPLRTAAARGVPGLGRLRNHAAAAAPLRRSVTAEEVARAVVWLGGSASGGITGQTVRVDAGYSAIVPLVDSEGRKEGMNE